MIMDTSVYLGILINIGVLAFYIIMFFSGYRRGFILQLVDLIGLLVALYVAWLISPIIASVFPIVPISAMPLTGTMISEWLHNYLNQIVWMILIVILVKLLLLIVKPMIKIFQKIPVIKQINGLLGAGFSIITTTVWILIITLVLSLPFMKINPEVIEKSWLGTISTGTSKMITILEKPLLTSKVLNDLSGNFDQLTEEEVEEITKWLEKMK